MEDYRCVGATDDTLMGEVIRLRAECYSADLGRIVPPAPDRFDGRPNCPSFLLLRSEAPAAVGTIRACVFDPSRPDLAVPALDTHSEEVSAAVGPGVPFVQSSHFAIRPGRRGAGMRPILLLFREVLRAAVDSGSRHIVTVVRVKGTYLAFYRRLGFVPIAAEKPHPVFGVPTVCLSVDLAAAGFREITSEPRFASLFQGLA